MPTNRQQTQGAISNKQRGLALANQKAHRGGRVTDKQLLRDVEKHVRSENRWAEKMELSLRVERFDSNLIQENSSLGILFEFSHPKSLVGSGYTDYFEIAENELNIQGRKFPVTSRPNKPMTSRPNKPIASSQISGRKKPVVSSDILNALEQREAVSRLNLLRKIASKREANGFDVTESDEAKKFIRDASQLAQAEAKLLNVNDPASSEKAKNVVSRLVELQQFGADETEAEEAFDALADYSKKVIDKAKQDYDLRGGDENLKRLGVSVAELMKLPSSDKSNSGSAALEEIQSDLRERVDTALGYYKDRNTYGDRVYLETQLAKLNRVGGTHSEADRYLEDTPKFRQLTPQTKEFVGVDQDNAEKNHKPRNPQDRRVKFERPEKAVKNRGTENRGL